MCSRPGRQLIPSFHVLICPLQPAAPTTGLHKLDDAVPCTEVPARTLRTSSACQSIIETLVPGRPQALACAPTFWCPLFLCFLLKVQVTMLPATPNTRLKKMIKLFQKMAANSALAKSGRSVKYDLHQRVNRMPFGQNGFKKTT